MVYVVTTYCGFLVGYFDNWLCKIGLWSVNAFYASRLKYELHTGWIISNNDLAWLSSNFPHSWLLALKFGMKQVIMAGGFLVTVSFLFLSFSNSFYLYMLIMFLCGAGSALVFSSIMSLLVIQFQKKKGLVLGVLLSGVGSGMLLSGLMTTYLIRYFPVWEWRAIWLIFSIVSILFTLLSWIVLKEPGKSVTNKDDRNQGVAHAYKNRKILRVGIIYFLIGLSYPNPFPNIIYDTLWDQRKSGW